MSMCDFGFRVWDFAGGFSRLLGSVQSAIAKPKSEITTLAYRPFLDPAPIDGYWLWFLPPLILVIALVYRTIKARELSTLPRSVAYLAFQISVFMLLAGAALWLLLLLV